MMLENNKAKITFDNKTDINLVNAIDNAIEHNKHGEGCVFLIQFANYNNIALLHGEELAVRVISNVVKVIREILQKSNITNYSLISYSMGYCIVINELNFSKEDLAFNLYKNITLYNEDIDSLHLYAHIFSISFPNHGKSGQEIAHKLFSMWSEINFSHNQYYLDYDSVSFSAAEIKERYKKLNILKNAYVKNRLMFAFQPVINSRTGETSHQECLLRIRSAEKDVQSAGPIIPIAEELGFISIIDDLVLDMLVTELQNSKDIIFAFNASNIGVHTTHFIDNLEKKLNDPALAKRVVIEITETALHYNIDKTREFIHRAHKLGCKVALDDFGSGYTSFKQLKKLPFDIIKIDGAFIKDIFNNIDNKLFVETLVRVAEELGAQTVAEFVENGEIAKYMIDLKIDFMQGNYFSPAITYRTWTKQ